MSAPCLRRALAVLALVTLASLSGCFFPDGPEVPQPGIAPPEDRDGGVREGVARVEFADALPFSGAPLATLRVAWRLNGPWTDITEAAVHARPANASAEGADGRNESFTQTHRSNLSTRPLGVFVADVALPPTGALVVQPRVRVDGEDAWGNASVVTVRDAPAVGVYLAAWPASARAGEVVNVSWAVLNVPGTEIPHTALHYGNTSHGGRSAAALDTSTYPEATRYRNDRAPTWFEETVVVGDGGFTFVRAHAIMDRVAYWTPEVAISVSGPSER